MTPYGHGNQITEIIGTLLRSDRTIPEIAEEFGLTFAAMLELLESPLAQAELAALEKLSALRERIRIPLQRDTALHRLTHIAAFSLSENESRRAATTLIRASNPVPPTRRRVDPAAAVPVPPTRLRVGVPAPTAATNATPPLTPSPFATPPLDASMPHASMPSARSPLPVPIDTPAVHEATARNARRVYALSAELPRPRQAQHADPPRAAAS